MAETNSTPDVEKVAHTPGPWGVEVIGDMMRVVSDVWEGIGDDVALMGDVHKPVTLANARLIAAAPDLLEACKAAALYDEAIALHGLRGDDLKPYGIGALAQGDDLDALYMDWQAKTSVAIAKAEGRDA